MKFAAALMLMLPLIASGRVPLAKTEEEGEIWAVLVAGTEEWDEYRFEADICHAYQILSANGIPDDHIVVMMFDNIADNMVNPFPGKIFNSPTGDDVYAGVPKDYTGLQVNPENFFKVLRGDAEGLKGIGSGKVINSGPNDRIFISIEGFGDTGIFYFPRDLMRANDFANLVMELKQNNRFKEMMVYMGSSCSGSMFQDLFPDDIGFYALSAADLVETTYAAYCFDAPIYNCLGDIFGVSWMEDVDAKDPNTELLKENFEVAKERTYLSTVMQWGQKAIENEPVAAFMGSKGSYTSPPKNYSVEERKASVVPSRDVPLVNLQKRLRDAITLEEKARLSSEITALKNKRSMVKHVTEKIVLRVAGDEKLAQELMTRKQEKITAWDCYKDAVDAFHDNCLRLGKTTFATNVVPTLLNLCESGYNSDVIVQATKSVCVFPAIHNDH